MVCSRDGSFLGADETVGGFAVGDYADDGAVFERKRGLCGVYEGLEIRAVAGD